MTATAVIAAGLGIVVGLVIGGLGGGGGVLTVPALVYVLGQSAHDATTGSVLIVGVTSLVGAVARIRERGVAWRTGIAFGVVGIPAAYLGTLTNRHVAQPVLLMAFAFLTLTAAAAMLWRGDECPEEPSETGGAGTPVVHRGIAVLVAKIVGCGVAVGFLTGFLGVGGGFLVVPALVLVLRMPMVLAIGTSLFIIVLNAVSSLLSRTGDLDLQWQVIAPFAVAAIAASLVAKRVSRHLSGTTLTRAFAVMVGVVGLFVAVESVVALVG
ncbi:MAG: sulfite exporter TauE/SafE family protein [Pseudonocardia sp.]|nr:sulfite exporter TauE/SafE family protein [Pseudonocardia sp.]